MLSRPRKGPPNPGLHRTPPADLDGTARPVMAVQVSSMFGNRSADEGGMFRINRRLTPAIAVALLWGGGCTPSPQLGGGQHRSGNAPDGSAIQYLTCDGRPYLVVWADGCDLPSDRGLRSGFNVWGELTTPGGSCFVWCCETDDKHVGRDGLFSSFERVAKEARPGSQREFRLSAGGLFLVHGRESPVRVEQIPADLTGLESPPDPDSLLRACGSDARVTAFHAACVGKR